MTDPAEIPTLFHDYVGVLHPAPIGAPPGYPLQLDPDDDDPGRKLFDRGEALAKALDGLEVRVVLSTSWAAAVGYAHAKTQLPPAPASRCVGATWDARGDIPGWGLCTRYEQIRAYVDRHEITRWIAIDDDDDGWPLPDRHRLICTLPYEGVTDDDLLELVRRLRNG